MSPDRDHTWAKPTAMRERRKFFERPECPRPMRVTERDIALLQNIARFRLASGAQLARLASHSETHGTYEGTSPVRLIP